MYFLLGRTVPHECIFRLSKSSKTLGNENKLSINSLCPMSSTLQVKCLTVARVAVMSSVAECESLPKYTFMSYIRGLLEKYPTFGREKETGLLGVLDT